MVGWFDPFRLLVDQASSHTVFLLAVGYGTAALCLGTAAWSHSWRSCLRPRK